MKTTLSLLAFACLVSGVRAEDDPGVPQTVAYVQKLQTSTGGFLDRVPPPNVRMVPTLRATSSGVRALKYLGAKLPNPDGAAKYVASCFDSVSGGFSNLPKGEPDVFATAVGIMAVTELKMPTEPYALGVLKYLTENAKGFEDIRIAAAGLERVSAKSPKNDEWLAAIRKLQNPDGTFGKGLGQARDTGGSVVILLRLGASVEMRDAILEAMKEGQRPSGGFGKADSELDADLETSYRVMRGFVMLKSNPARMEGLRTFVAKCRNEDGGYGASPGQDSGIGPTYFAAILKHWLDRKE